MLRPLLLKLLIAFCVLDCVEAQGPSSPPPGPPVLMLNVTYYDFRVHEDGHNNSVTHPDFERSCVPPSFPINNNISFFPCEGKKGLVEATLGLDGRYPGTAHGTAHGSTQPLHAHHTSCSTSTT